MDSSNADPWEGFTGQSQADADDALIMDPLVRQISELRAAFADSEARRAELEAAIQRAREAAQPTANGEPLRERVIEALDSVPSVVLEDRDAAVWDQGFLRGLIAASRINEDETLADWEYPTRNPYRGDNR